ncbi:MFS general substrate transporter [Armillaria solidipes]|uniref:MFS general substrate transporter n=1 Tax=Armillaria solidipes TaxID=1076256 RepID=A0A2H3ATB4_9AGAR|nr:MFS general substrate transporter [Armillaria solidipes]
MISDSGKPEQEWQEEFANTVYEPGSEVEKRLVRKIDRHIVPTVWVLYTLSYLDRANIGNAKSGGMEEALSLTSNQYSIILLVFFISYVIFEVPANMFLTRVRPSYYLSGLCFIWGAVAASMAAASSYRQLAGVRFCLGVVEAGFAPGIAFYLSSWYKRHELAKRFAIYYTATTVSGAFSGLLAGVITDNLDGAREIDGWKWLLLIEGVASSFGACFTWMILPDLPSTTKWLTPEERIGRKPLLGILRLAYEGIGNTATGESDAPSHKEALYLAINNWRTWALSFMYMLATGAQTIQYFIPSLVGQLGYTGYTKQYMTIPIYMVALVDIVFFCFLSDIRKERGNYVTITSLIAGVSFIITVAVDDQKVKYAFLCFAVAGIHAACPLTLLWVSDVIDHPAEKRAVAIAIVNGLGNSASIYGSFFWPSNTGPRYVQGFATTTAFVLALAVSAQILKLLLKRYPSKGLNDDLALAKDVKDVDAGGSSV